MDQWKGSRLHKKAHTVAKQPGHDAVLFLVVGWSQSGVK